MDTQQSGLDAKYRIFSGHRIAGKLQLYHLELYTGEITALIKCLEKFADSNAAGKTKLQAALLLDMILEQLTEQ